MASADSSVAAQQVGPIYERVVDDVLENVRQSFRDEGLDESVLNDLRLLWMDKLARQGQVSGTSVPSHPPGQAAASNGNYKPAGAGSAATADNTGKASWNFFPHNKAGAAKPAATAQASGAVKVDQTDGAFGDDSPTFHVTRLAQHDGGSNDKSDGAASKADPHDDEELSSSDEDEDAPDPEDEENFIICQYEKVARQKNKYKVQLKQGIMSVNGTEYMFNRADGQFTW